MTKSKKNDTSITPESRKEMPSRGKGAKTLILDAMRERAVLELTEDSTKEDAEKAYFGFLAEAAFNPTPDTAVVSNTCLATLSKKGWPDMKATLPLCEFNFNPEGTPTQKATDILNAVSNGEIPADIGLSLISAMASVLKIEEVTEIKERLDKIEEALNGDS